jgi:hypothetical protein
MHPPSIEEEAYFKAAFQITDRAGHRNLYDIAKVIRQQA